MSEKKKKERMEKKSLDSFFLKSLISKRSIKQDNCKKDLKITLNDVRRRYHIIGNALLKKWRMILFFVICLHSRTFSQIY